MVFCMRNIIFSILITTALLSGPALAKPMNVRGGNFKAVSSELMPRINNQSPADFDGDGWEDFVAGDTSGYTSIETNDSRYSLSSPENWNDPDSLLLPDLFSDYVPGKVRHRQLSHAARYR